MASTKVPINVTVDGNAAIIALRADRDRLRAVIDGAHSGLFHATAVGPVDKASPERLSECVGGARGVQAMLRAAQLEWSR